MDRFNLEVGYDNSPEITANDIGRRYLAGCAGWHGILSIKFIETTI
jgi:hypothetical protein